MKAQRVRGVAWDEPDANVPMGMNVIDNILEDVSGFRLVYDSEEPKLNRGGIWAERLPPRVAVSDMDDPAACINFLGFRLVWETP